VINMAGVPKRQEISVKDFEQALDVKACAVIEYDCETFGQASNNGQMIEEMNAKAKAVAQFRDIALTMTRRPRSRRPTKKKSPLSALAPFLEKLKLKR
jgi:pilus assembly protein CpaE